MSTGAIGLDRDLRNIEVRPDNGRLEDTRDPEAIQVEIARTRASLNRKLAELERRLSPSRRLAQAKRSLHPGRLDPRPYPEWIAVGAVVTGSLLALAGWRRSRRVAEDELEDLVIFETSCR